MAAATQISADRWLQIRDAVAEKLKENGSRQQEATRASLAEGLLREGWIDVDAVLESLEPTKTDPLAGMDLD